MKRTKLLLGIWAVLLLTTIVNAQTKEYPTVAEVSGIVGNSIAQVQTDLDDVSTRLELVEERVNTIWDIGSDIYGWLFGGGSFVAFIVAMVDRKKHKNVAVALQDEVNVLKS
jgi:hypothetical protein